MGQSLLENTFSKVLCMRFLNANATMGKNPITHGLELLERDKWNLDLVVRSCCSAAASLHALRCFGPPTLLCQEIHLV
jgi:hypothetical protein